MVVRSPPDHRDDEGGGGGEGRPWREDDHVDAEDETAGREDAEDDGEDDVELLLLLSLVDLHGFRGPGSDKLISDIFILFVVGPVPTVQHTVLLHPPYSTNRKPRKIRQLKLADSPTQPWSTNSQ